VLFPGLIIGALTLLAGMVSPHHNAKKPWKEAVAVSVAKMQMLAGQILFPTFLYYADARCGTMVLVCIFGNQGRRSPTKHVHLFKIQEEFASFHA